MAQLNPALIPALNQSLDMEMPENISAELLKERLSSHINHLIQYEFKKLVAVLYKIDVNEEKLNQLLSEHKSKNAASIIAELIIDRQKQKIKSRQKFRRDDNINEEEKW